jgi:hypothetical protein
MFFAAASAAEVTKMSPENPSGRGPEVDASDTAAVLELHLYEYQALTTRVTYLVTMLYALWPLVFGALAFLASLWDTHRHSYVEWTGLLLGETLAAAFYFTSCEICTHVCYIETDLRHRVAKITADPEFWGWEPWLSRFRSGLHSSQGLRWWELWPSWCTAAAICVIGISRWPWSVGDYAAVALGTVGFSVILVLSLRLRKIRAIYEMKMSSTTSTKRTAET